MRLFKSAQWSEQITHRKLLPLSPRLVAELVVYGVLYVVFATVSTAYFSSDSTNIPLIFFSTGVAIIMVMRYGRYALGAIFVASLVVNYSLISRDLDLWSNIHTLIAALIDTSCPWLMVKLIRHLIPNGLQEFKGWILLLKIAVIPIILAATASTLNLFIGDYIHADSLVIYTIKLFFAHFIGAVLIYVMYDAYLSDRSGARAEQVSAAWVGMSIALLLMVLAKFCVSGIIFFVIPTIIAFSFFCANKHMYTVLLFCIAALAYIFNNDFGPFVQPSLLQSQVMLQAYVLTLSVLTVGTCIVKSRLERMSDSREYWQELARYDDLTQLLQRNAFMDILSERLHRSGSEQQHSCVIVADLDHFKKINDKYGHIAGDAVLRTVADCFRKHLREDDLASRFGGEEFVLLLHDLDLEQANRIAQRVRLAISCLRFAQYGDLTVTISMGVAQVDYAHDDPFADAFSHADSLLYRAKNLGRNCVVSQAACTN
ncbi:GGDEF domain-containing protein [Pseudoalteromonas sp. SSDWG2]|uniref:GGDEF domain-containing protein n=1 Tax=Pseudoalteromonas sp. SSDWG2 TaxID=3139391 RepID=UPI003BABEB0C